MVVMFAMVAADLIPEALQLRSYPNSEYAQSWSGWSWLMSHYPPDIAEVMVMTCIIAKADNLNTTVVTMWPNRKSDGMNNKNTGLI